MIAQNYVQEHLQCIISKAKNLYIERAQKIETAIDIRKSQPANKK